MEVRKLTQGNVQPVFITAILLCMAGNTEAEFYSGPPIPISAPAGSDMTFHCDVSIVPPVYAVSWQFKDFVTESVIVISNSTIISTFINSTDPTNISNSTINLPSRNDSSVTIVSKYGGSTADDPSLTVHHVEYFDQGLYRCFLNDSEFEWEKTSSIYELLVQEGPGGPEGLTMTTTENSTFPTIPKSTPVPTALPTTSGLESTTVTTPVPTSTERTAVPTTFESTTVTTTSESTTESTIPERTTVPPSLEPTTTDSITLPTTPESSTVPQALKSTTESTTTAFTTTEATPLIGTCGSCIVSVIFNNSAILPCNITANQQVTSVTWQRLENGVYVDFYTTTIMGSPTLTIESTTFEDAGIYRCTVNSSDGQGFGEPVSLTVLGDTPEVWIRHASYSVQYGGTVTISCEHYSEPEATSVVWWKFTDMSVMDKVHDSLVTGWSVYLTISNATSKDEGYYFCEVKNLIGATQGHMIWLSVNGDTPVITPLPASQTNMNVSSGTTVSFPCLAQATPPINNLVWTKQLGNDAYSIVNSSYGVMVPSLDLLDVEITDRGNYQCKVKNSVGAATTLYQLDVYQKNPFVSLRVREEIVPYGSNITFHCGVLGLDNQQVLWKHESGTQTRFISLENGESDLFLEGVTQKDEGLYTCQRTAKNVQKTYSVVQLKILLYQPVLVIREPTLNSVHFGVQMVFHCDLDFPGPISGVGWIKSDREKTFFIGDKNPVLMINNVTMINQGFYSCFLQTDEQKYFYSEPVYLRVKGSMPSARIKLSHLALRNGDDITIPCDITSDLTLTLIQWKKDGHVILEENLTNVTSHVSNEYSTNGHVTVYLELFNLTTLDEGKYTCTVENLLGKVTSAEIEVFVDRQLKPFVQLVTSQSNTGTITQGSSLELNCSIITIVSNTSVTWQKENQGEVTLIEPEETEVFVEYAVHRLMIDSVTGKDNGTYRCVAFNKYGTGVSDAFALKVTNESIPMITAPVLRYSAKVGQNVTLDCVMEPSETNTFIYWVKVNGGVKRKILEDRNKYRLTSNKYTSLTILNVDYNDEGHYMCHVENTVGLAHSEEIDLTIENYIPLVVTGKRKEYYVSIGKEVTLSCDAADGSYSSVSWVKNQVKLKDIDKDLTITGAKVEDQGTYTCMFFDGVETKQSEMFLHVRKYAPFVSIQQPSYFINHGQTIIVHCKIQSSPPHTAVSWTRTIEEKQTTRITSLLLGGRLQLWDRDNQSLVISQAREEDKGWYTCLATNMFGTTSSQMTYLTVLGGNPPSVSILFSSLSVYRNDNITLPCKVSNFDLPLQSVTWFKVRGQDRKEIMIDEQKFYGSSIVDPTLTLIDLELEDEGYYICEAENSAGVGRSQPFYLSIKEFTVITPVEEYFVCYGDTVTLHCLIFDDEVQSVSWYKIKDGGRKLVTSDPLKYSEVTTENPNLTIYSLTDSDSAVYRCQGTNKDGEIDWDETEVIVGYVYFGSLQLYARWIPSYAHLSESEEIKQYFELQLDTFYKRSTFRTHFQEIMITGAREVVKSYSGVMKVTKDTNIPSFQDDLLYLLYPVEEIDPNDLPLANLTVSYESFSEHFNTSEVLQMVNDTGSGELVGKINAFLSIVNSSGFQSFGSAAVDVSYSLFVPEVDITMVISDQSNHDSSSFIQLVTSYTQYQSGNSSLDIVEDIFPGDVVFVDSSQVPLPSIPPLQDVLTVSLGSNHTFNCISDDNHAVDYSTVLKIRHGVVDELTDTSFEIYVDEMTDGTTFVCILTNRRGTVFRAFEVHVLGEITLPKVNTVGRSNHIVKYGDNVLLECSYDGGKQDKHVFWRKHEKGNEMNLTLEEHIGVMSNETSLTIFNVTKSDEGFYTCYVRNRIGISWSQPVTVTVEIDPPKVDITSESFYLGYGETVTLGCEVTSISAINAIYWQKTISTGSMVAMMQLETTHGTKYRGGNLTSPSLEIYNINQTDEGYYACYAENKVATGRSDFVYLKVEASPPDVYIPKHQGKFIAGINSTLQCLVTSQPQSAVTWFKQINGIFTNISKGLASHFVSADNKLQVYGRPSDSGFYMCVAENPIGFGSDVVYLSIIADYPIVSIQEKVKRVKIGQEVRLDCEVISYPPYIGLTWMSEVNNYSKPLDMSSSKYASTVVDLTSLVINNVRIENAGKYRCQAQNSIGVGESENVLLEVVSDSNPFTCWPIFTSPVYWIQNKCSEDFQGTIDMRCTGNQSALQCTVGEVNGVFLIQPHDGGTFSCCYKLNHSGSYEIPITVSDGKSNFIYKIPIEVQYHDTMPVFIGNQHSCQVGEDAWISDPVPECYVMVGQPTVGNVTFTLKGSSLFGIDAQSGQIFCAGYLRENVTQSITVLVTATNTVSDLIANITVTIHIVDVDEPPNCQGTMDVVNVGVAVGERVFQATCIDPDTNPEFIQHLRLTLVSNESTTFENSDSSFFELQTVSQGKTTIVTMVTRKYLLLTKSLYSVQMEVSAVFMNGSLFVHEGVETVPIKVDLTPPPPMFEARVVNHTKLEVHYWFPREDFYNITNQFILHANEMIRRLPTGERHFIVELYENRMYSVKIIAYTELGILETPVKTVKTSVIPILSNMLASLKLMNQTFDKSLFDPLSQRYQYLASSVTNRMTYILRDDPGFVSAEVLMFRMGSVVVDVGLTVNQSSTSNQIDQTLTQAVQARDLYFDPAFYQFSMGDGRLQIRTITSSSPFYQDVTVTFTCVTEIIGRTGDITVFWYLNNSLIQRIPGSRWVMERGPENTMMPHLKEFLLTINKLKPSDSGNLTCEAHSMTSSLHDRKTVEMQVVPKPVASILPLTATIKQGGNITIECNITRTVLASSEILWLKDGVVLDSYSDEMIEVQEYGISERLVLKDLQRSTLYKCYGRNIAGDGNIVWTNITVIKQEDIQKLCPTSTDEFGMVWEETVEGVIVIKPCTGEFTGNVSRVCSGGKWLEPDYSNCFRKDLLELKDQADKLKEGVGTEVVDQILQSLTTLTDIDQGKLTTGDLTTTTTTLLDVAEYSALRTDTVTNNQLDVSNVAEYSALRTDTVTNNQLDDFLSSADNILEEDNKQGWTQLKDKDVPTISTFVEAVTTYSKSYTESETQKFKKSVERKNLVAQFGRVQNEDIVFPDRSDINVDWIQNTKSVVRLKKASERNQLIGYESVYYRNISSLFPSYLLEDRRVISTDLDVNSDIIDFSIVPPIQHLDPPLVINFEILKNGFTRPVCVFWDLNARAWSTRGARLKNATGTSSACEYDHTTNFAILMSPVGSKPSGHETTLNYISAIGCGISILFLVITVIVYVLLWKYVKSDKAKILICLCVSLVISYLLFLFGVKQAKNKNACTAIAVLLHYFFLVDFFLMLSMAIEIAFQILYVMPTKPRFKRLLPLGFGAPAAIVGISLGATQLKGYGSTRFCWLSVDKGVIWSFIGPALTVVLVNLVILVLVIRALFKSMTNKIGSKKSTKTDLAKSGARSICVLAPLFGVTWIFGVASVSSETVIFQYLFAILNSLQGLFIFIFHCILDRKIRNGFQKRISHRRKKKKTSFESSVSSSRMEKIEAIADELVHKGYQIQGCLGHMNFAGPSKKDTAYLNKTLEEIRDCGENLKKISETIKPKLRQAADNEEKLKKIRIELSQIKSENFKLAKQVKELESEKELYSFDEESLLSDPSSQTTQAQETRPSLETASSSNTRAPPQQEDIVVVENPGTSAEGVATEQKDEEQGPPIKREKRDK